MKKQFLVLTIICLVFSLSSLATDTYKRGDYLFVWAQSGLNLRHSPTTKSAKIRTLSFGQKVTVVERMDISYEMEMISSAKFEGMDKSFPALKMKGHWVRVATDDGESGYVIDQYLLKFEPAERNSESESLLNLSTRRVDTLFQKPQRDAGEGLYLTVKSYHDHGVEAISKMGGVWGETCYTIPNSSMEEVLIMFSSSYNNYEGFLVYKKEENRIFLSSNDELCSYSFVQKEGFVEFRTACSC